MKNKVKYGISLLLIGLMVVFFININYGGETVKASDPNECCLNGYKLWFTQGPMGFFDCNCNNQAGEPDTPCSCPKQPQESN